MLFLICLIMYIYNPLDYNAQQRLAIETNDKNLLILAGAGTGKTTTLIGKILYNIDVHNLQLGQVLMTTFTNKAAKEMQARLAGKLSSVGNAWIGTFHKLSMKIVEQHTKFLNLNALQIIDPSDQLQMINKMIKERKIKNLSAYSVIDAISQYKESNVPINDLYKEFYSAYEEELAMLQMIDFSDLLQYTIKLWKEFPDILRSYQNQFKLICVDEYQDINQVQYEWLKLLCCDTQQLCCVGDPDQAIYSFRGANVKYILNFQNDFKNTKMVILNENYRSTKNILNAANNLIANNHNRIAKKLFTQQIHEQKVELLVIDTMYSEARTICKKIQQIQKNDPEASIVVLCRTNTIMYIYEGAFSEHKISYQLTGGMQLVDRAEVKQVLAYIKFLYNNEDYFAFSRMIQFPKKGIGKVTISQILEIHQTQNIPLIEALQSLKDKFSLTVRDRIELLVSQLLTWQKMFATDSAFLVGQKILNESGVLVNTEENKQKYLLQWLESLRNFSTLKEYVKNLIWQSEDMRGQAVQLMTIHAAKGLEYDYVFLPNLVVGYFPHAKALSIDAIEEERRLAYVAITRAKKYLLVSYAKLHRQQFISSPSRFIKEIGEVQGFVLHNHKFKVDQYVHHMNFGTGKILELDQYHAKVSFHGKQKRILPLGSLKDL